MNENEDARALAEEVMGWPVIDENEPFRNVVEFGGYILDGLPFKFTGFGYESKVFTPRTDIAQAMRVAETFDSYLLEKRTIEDFLGLDPARVIYRCTLVSSKNMDRHLSGWESTPAAAICAAAIKTREKKDIPRPHEWPTVNIKHKKLGIKTGDRIVLTGTKEEK